ncbi:hypothetical protein [Cystobacter ferrugineus]|uniref:Uncharacterized protein n=1 Tax=Cystobacter ferrugineus TaxID=83449 RepID=A0A1L9B3P2_9BACT|nr:hypothetical protein [Cystobacter ferrugineus]OJH36891.1 hypothetical protein BON30_30825 [Cystobacter ferrugineus]
MSPSHAVKWFLLIPLASAVLVGCGAIEPPPPEYPHATVTFDVTVPEGTPSDAIITVLGSHSSLGGNTAPGFYLRRQANGHYTGMVRLAIDAEVSYTLWREDVWTPELSPEGTAMPRRSFRVTGDMTVSAQMARWGQPLQGPPSL